MIGYKISESLGPLSIVLFFFSYLDRVVDEMNQTENFSKNEIQSLIAEDWVRELGKWAWALAFLGYSDSLILTGLTERISVNKEIENYLALNWHY